MAYKSSPEFRCWRMCILSSSELCEDEDGSTSETPESAGLGGKDPAKTVNKYYVASFTNKQLL